MKKKKRFYKWSLILIFSFFTIALGMYVADKLSLTNTLVNKSKFYEGTYINGINVSGMTVNEVSNIIASSLNENRSDVKITLTYKDKSWTLNGDDFPTNNKVQPTVENIFTYGRTGSFWDRRSAVSEISKQGYHTNISYMTVLGGIDTKLEEIFVQIEKPMQNPSATFKPNQKNPFEYTNGENGITVDRETLYKNINTEFESQKQITVEIPTFETQPTETLDEIKYKTSLIGSFSTSYKNSQKGRKNNIKKALNYFNGMIVEPATEISFNETTKVKPGEKDYDKANIILNGVYVLGTGGGICQASTTLYNALLVSGVDILEANKHSLPVSYVKLALDAMVSDGISDMRFRNSSDSNIYIETNCNDETCTVNIYGEPQPNGETLKTRVEFIRTIPHNGDIIIQDKNGEYSNKITFKGEYYRLKKPQEGYEAIAYLERFDSDNNLISNKEIRHEIYQPQQGVIVEGTEELAEGMTLPENDVEFIPPQETQSQVNENNVQNKIENQNPSEYNP